MPIPPIAGQLACQHVGGCAACQEIGRHLARDGRRVVAHTFICDAVIAGADDQCPGREAWLVLACYFGELDA